MTTINIYKYKLVSAHYGINKQCVNVTSIIKNIIDKKINIFKVNNKTMGSDPCNKRVKELTIKMEKKVFIIKEGLPVIFIYNDKVITLDNIDKLKLFSQYKIARIFGKGPSFKNIIKKNDNELHIAVNQASNLIDTCDVLIINDLHNIDKVKDDTIRKLKFIILPEFLHIKWKFNIKGHWSVVFDKIHNLFTGHYIIYNLRTSRYKNKNLISLPSTITSANTVNDFICLYLKKYIKRIDFYGIGIIGKNYHKDFIGYGNYNNARIIKIKKNIHDMCKKHKVSFTIN